MEFSPGSKFLAKAFPINLWSLSPSITPPSTLKPPPDTAVGTQESPGGTVRVWTRGTVSCVSSTGWRALGREEGKKTEGSPLCTHVLDSQNPDNHMARSMPSGRGDEAKRREATCFSKRKGRNVNFLPSRARGRVTANTGYLGLSGPARAQAGRSSPKRGTQAEGSKSREAPGPRQAGFAQLFLSPLAHVHTQSTRTHMPQQVWQREVRRGPGRASRARKWVGLNHEFICFLPTAV